MSELSPQIIKLTQETLGKYVKKPALTEKLLKKPPFRFLHDIIASVIRDTGFLIGLYSPEELISDHVKDKDSKIRYLQRLIDVLKLATGENITARPSKIVAGQDPDKTNELLQVIGKAIERKVNCNEAIKKVKGGVTNLTTTTRTTIPTNKPKPMAKDVKEKPKDTTFRGVAKKTPAVTKIVKCPEKDVEQQKKPPPLSIAKDNSSKRKTSMSMKKSTATNLEKQQMEDKVETPVQHTNPAPDSESQKSEPGHVVHEKTSEELIQKQVIAEPEASIEFLQNDLPTFKELDMKPLNETKLEKKPLLTPQLNRASSKDELSAIIDEEAERRRKEQQTLKKNHRKEPVQSESVTVNEVEEPTAERITGETKPTLFRQNSVGDKIVPQHRTSLRPPSVRPVSARPAAPRRKDKNIEIVLNAEEAVKMGDITVKIDTLNQNFEDDGENLIIIENIMPLGDRDNFNDNSILEPGDQGHLVKQILDAQKEFSNKDRSDDHMDKGWEPSEVHRRQTSNCQMNNLCTAIQALTRLIYPLGKIISDLLPESFDSMQQELTMWQNMYLQTSVELQREQKLIESAVEPLRINLAQTEQHIKEYIDLINTIQLEILQDDVKLKALVTEST